MNTETTIVHHVLSFPDYPLYIIVLLTQWNVLFDTFSKGDPFHKMLEEIECECQGHVSLHDR